MLPEGLGTVLVAALLQHAVPATFQASVLGGLTFVGLTAGMLVQPLAGQRSDEQRAQTGRASLFALGTAGVVLGLALLAASRVLLIILLAPPSGSRRNLAQACLAATGRRKADARGRSCSDGR
jgi:hypothetical protein